jgi:hypothetical protein
MIKWKRELGTSKREQGIKTPKRPPVKKEKFEPYTPAKRLTRKERIRRDGPALKQYFRQIWKQIVKTSRAGLTYISYIPDLIPDVPKKKKNKPLKSKKERAKEKRANKIPRDKVCVANNKVYAKNGEIIHI